MEGNLDEVAGRERVLELEHAAGYGNRLKFCARTLATFGMNSSRNGTIELDTGCTTVGVGSGEVGHSHLHYVMGGQNRADYQSACTREYAYNPHW